MRFTQTAARTLRFVGEAAKKDWLDDLVDYAASFDPTIPERLVPATPEDLAELERLAGAPIPASYRLFLERMGGDPTPITDEFRARLELSEVLDLYRDTPPDERPAGAFLIGFGVMSVYPELALRPLASDPGGEPQLVTSDEAEVVDAIARSFPRWLLQQTFLRFELEAYPVRQRYGLSRGRHTLERAKKAATEAGFAPYWFSDGYTFCGWAEGAGLAVHMLPGGSGWLVVGGVDAGRAARLGETLDAALGLQFQEKLVTPSEV